jgi:hypothetical protein
MSIVIFWVVTPCGLVHELHNPEDAVGIFTAVRTSDLGQSNFVFYGYVLAFLNY